MKMFQQQEKQLKLKQQKALQGPLKILWTSPAGMYTEHVVTNPLGSIDPRRPLTSVSVKV